jgi:trehalose 6-phosphate phosphatase
LKPYLSRMYGVMQDIPRTGSASRLERVSADAAECALFIDIDGTLLDMAPSPDQVMVPPGLVQTLSRLTKNFGGAIALITGRRVADADRFFAPLRLVTSGVHGTEARTQAGGNIAMLAPPAPAGLLQAVKEMARLSPGILVEVKGAGIAVHYRHAPKMRATIELELERIAGQWDDFDLRSGRKVLDLIPKCCSKGTGLKSLMRLPAFHNRRPVMIGDDHGDEPAMLEAQRLGGIGLRVAGEHFRRKSADFDSAASVRRWLAALATQPRPAAHAGAAEQPLP